MSSNLRRTIEVTSLAIEALFDEHTQLGLLSSFLGNSEFHTACFFILLLVPLLVKNLPLLLPSNGHDCALLLSNSQEKHAVCPAICELLFIAVKEETP